MSTSMSTIRTGAFILVGLVSLLTLIFLIGSQEGQFHSTFQARTSFASVEGVRAGSAVRLAGVDIGIVDKVEVSPSDARVHVVLKLDSRFRDFIKKDSYATIMPEGLVGSSYIDVTVGSRSLLPIEDGDAIPGKESPRLSTILGSTTMILAEIHQASSELNTMLASVNRGRGTLGKLVTDDGLYDNLERISSRADSGLSNSLTNMDSLFVTIRLTAHGIDSILATVNSVTRNVKEGKGTLGALVTERSVYDSLLLAVHNTVQATEQASLGARRFAEDMEALKHHWLLKGYFEDRGYWDEAEYKKELDKKIDSLKTLSP